MDPITQRIWMPSGGDFTDACWFQGAATNSTAMAIGTLDLYNVSVEETAWSVPAGVTSISIAVVAAGAGGQQYGSGAAKPASWGGGELVWRNGISVTAGQTLYVHCGITADRSSVLSNGSSVGGGGAKAKSTSIYKYINSPQTLTESYYADSVATNYSRASYVRAWDGGANKFLIFAEGGVGEGDIDGGDDAGSRMSSPTNYGTLGTEGSDWAHHPGGAGGGVSNQTNSWLAEPRGSGGAGGWTGAGGNGGNSTDANGSAGSGGAGGGGASGPASGNNASQSHGGNVFMWGSGDSGTAGTASSTQTASRGGDGSQTGTGATNPIPDGLGEGGGGHRDGWAGMNGHKPEYDGWVRIVWSTDGTTRNFPSTNVAYPG